MKVANPDREKYLMLDDCSIDILLSVFGNALFLPEMLRSLQMQSLKGATLLCRRDGPSRVPLHSLLSPHSTGLLQNDDHLGVSDSYWELLQNSTAEYVMFADQDDVWHPDKVTITLDFMRKQESIYGKDTPILVHTDLRVCDERLTVLHKSFVRFQALNPRLTDLRHMMIQNNVTGCAMMINRALKQLLRPFPVEAICHDWYIAMAAAAFGKIAFLPEATIDYRQHKNNVFGAIGRWPQKIHRLALHEMLVRTQRQAGAFVRQYDDLLSEEQKDVLEAWHNCSTQTSYIKKLNSVLKYRLRKNDWARIAGMWWAL